MVFFFSFNVFSKYPLKDFQFYWLTINLFVPWSNVISPKLLKQMNEI